MTTSLTYINAAGQRAIITPVAPPLDNKVSSTIVLPAQTSGEQLEFDFTDKKISEYGY